MSTDPRLDDGTEVDWAAEGGALPEGPATDPNQGEDATTGTSLEDHDVPEDG